MDRDGNVELGDCGSDCGAGACGVSYDCWKFYDDEMIVWRVVKGAVNERSVSLRFSDFRRLGVLIF